MASHAKMLGPDASEPAKKCTEFPGRHDLQYFETFCNSGIAKASRFSGKINWVQFEIGKTRTVGDRRH